MTFTIIIYIIIADLSFFVLIRIDKIKLEFELDFGFWIKFKIKIMSQVSKYPVSKDVSDRMFEVFQVTISSLQSKDEIEEFFDEFFSPIEKIMLAKRLSIAVLLTKGYSYHSISSILKVTPRTIATVSLALKYRGKGYQKAVKKILSNEKINAFWGKIEDLLGGLPPTKGSFIYFRDKYEREKRKRKSRVF